MGQYTVAQIEAAREVPITRLLGMQNRRRISIQCPFHKDKTPSCSLYSTGGFHCFACGAHGRNSIDFLMKLGYSFAESMDELVQYI